MSAVTWPSEWPANATGASMCSRTASHATSEVSRTASCASRVRASCLGGGVEQERGERLAQGRPRPGRRRSRPRGRARARPCLWLGPWPGKMTAMPTSSLPPERVVAGRDQRCRGQGYTLRFALRRTACNVSSLMAATCGRSRWAIDSDDARRPAAAPPAVPVRRCRRGARAGRLRAGSLPRDGRRGVPRRPLPREPGLSRGDPARGAGADRRHRRARGRALRRQAAAVRRGGEGAIPPAGAARRRAGHGRGARAAQRPRRLGPGPGDRRREGRLRGPPVLRARRTRSSS